MPRERSLDPLRRRIAARGDKTWRSIEELADTASFESFLESEFPAVARMAELPDRRRFLQLMGASFALAGLTGCDSEDPRAQEVPYVRQPERIQPGASLSYASIAILDGLANGVLVTTRNGRPIKIEGNPDHPWSRGGTDVFGQASVLGLYDPFRSQAARQIGRPSSWEAFRGVAAGRMAALRATKGAGVRLLTGPVSSPSLLAQIAAMQSAMPEMQWHVHSPVDREGLYEGAKLALGKRLETRWRFDRARVIVALDGDFLDPGPQQVGVARDWITARRQSGGGSGDLLTMHAVASTPTLTSAKADDTCPASPGGIAAIADRLLAPPSGAGDDPVSAWTARAATALAGARGHGIVMAGLNQPPAIHAAIHRVNAAFGNAGQTVSYTQPVFPDAGTLSDLVQSMRAGKVETLLILGANPVYDAPAELGFTDALKRVGWMLHAGLYFDETGAYSDWHLPLSHPLASWGDARSLDGTVGLMQPTIAPLYRGLSIPEIVSLLMDNPPRSGRELLQSHWQGSLDGDRWHQALQQGFVAGTSFHEETASANPAPAASPPRPEGLPKGLDVVFRPDPTVWDGAFGNNAWLQELPKPLTKIVWENVVGVSPRLAERERLATGDVVAIELGGRRVEGPVWIEPGQADGTITLGLGYGRAMPGLLVSGVGYNAYTLRTSGALWSGSGAMLRKTGRSATVATTQHHGTMEGHDFIRVHRVGGPAVGDPAGAPPPPSLYPPPSNKGPAWGMVIDLDACIGCNACVTACQAENNIPVVGKDQVEIGRELHWLRVDRYYEGALDSPETRFQPVPCMQCEQAPCEVGCPVEATLHDQEGLNLMVYNRCVGTRACSSYCPYKVRHFNYLDYTAGAAPSVQLQRNPEVTVRARGVMEKCTYCIQRIAQARITSDKKNQPIPEGAVETACQGACPTRAITFGDLTRPDGAVAKARLDPRHYTLLAELNTRPRTTYLAARAPAAEGTG